MRLTAFFLLLLHRYFFNNYQLLINKSTVEASARWTTSSTPSAHTTRTCATPFGIAETSSTPSDTAGPSNLYLLLSRWEDQENHDNPNNRRREEAEPSHASTERSTSSSVDTDRRKTEDSKSSTIAKYRWRPPVLPLRTDGRSTRSPSLGQINGSTSTTQANTRSQGRSQDPKIEGAGLVSKRPNQ